MDTSNDDNVGEAHLLGQPLTRCPACGSTRLEVVIERDLESVVNFRCADCGRCWHVELDHVHRVDPTTCGGCKYRQQCLEIYAADRAKRSS